MLMTPLLFCGHVFLENSYHKGLASSTCTTPAFIANSHTKGGSYVFEQ